MGLSFDEKAGEERFFLPISFSFSGPFYSYYPLHFYILSGCGKKLDVNYGKSLEMGP